MMAASKGETYEWWGGQPKARGAIGHNMGFWGGTFARWARRDFGAC